MTDLKLSLFEKSIRNCYNEAKSAGFTFELENYGGYGLLPSKCKYNLVDTGRRNVINLENTAILNSGDGIIIPPKTFWQKKCTFLVPSCESLYKKCLKKRKKKPETLRRLFKVAAEKSILLLKQKLKKTRGTIFQWK